MKKPDAFERQVERAIEVWKDLTVTRKRWEAMFPEPVRAEARHTMSLDDLRMRG